MVVCCGPSQHTMQTACKQIEMKESQILESKIYCEPCPSISIHARYQGIRGTTTIEERSCFPVKNRYSRLTGCREIQTGRARSIKDEAPEGFGGCPKTLIHLLQDKKLTDLDVRLGGTRGLAGKLGSNLEDGIKNDPEEIRKRQEACGSNKYPKKKPKGILIRMLGL